LRKEKIFNHPIAKSILNKYSETFKEDLNTEDITNFEEIPGKGLQYQYENETIKNWKCRIYKCRK